MRRAEGGITSSPDGRFEILVRKTLAVIYEVKHVMGGIKTSENVLATNGPCLVPGLR